jgi:predicted kinase
MNKIVLITGMSGSGKSTVGRLVAEHFSKSMHIDVDKLRHMMVKGRAVPDLAGFSEAAYQQCQWVRSTVIYMAQLYASQGVDVVIDDVFVPPNFVEQYAALFENPAVYRVLLFPTAPTLIERMKKRAGPSDHILVDTIPLVYSYLDPMPKDGWIVLDSSDQTIEQTVHEVLSHIGAVSEDTKS